MKKTTLAAMIGICCTTAYAQNTNVKSSYKPLPTPPTPPLVQAPNGFMYPQTRVHQDSLDPFLHGEFGLPDTATTAAFETPTPDDGIDPYSSQVLVDKYRWLEAYDPINPVLQKETKADRERNLIGTRLEDDAFDTAQLVEYMQTPDPNAAPSEVDVWVEAQNKATDDYLQNIAFYDTLQQNAQSLYNYKREITKVKRKEVGEFHYYQGIDGHRRIDLIGLDGTVTQLVNDTDFDDVNYVIAGGLKASKNGSYISFFAREGSADADRFYAYIMDVSNKQIVKQFEVDGGNKDIAWIDDSSFYYISPIVSSWKNQVMRHNLNKPTTLNPIEVLPEHIDGSDVSSISLEGDGRYLVIETYFYRPSFYIKDLHKNKVYRLHNHKFLKQEFIKNPKGFRRLVLAKLVHFDDKTQDVWLISAENDIKGEIIKTNLKNPKQRTVVVKTPENYDLLQEAYYHEEGDGYFLARFLKDGTDIVALLDHNGAVIKDLTPMSSGFADKLSGFVVGEDNDDDDEKDEFFNENYIQFAYENPTTPTKQYRYSIAKDDFIDIRPKSFSPFLSDDYESKTIFYSSYDGTTIPMVISHKKDIVLDGKNPTFLYGYGGYGVVYEQSFGFPIDLLWMESGGVWAHAMIRGGGEYGEAWQQAGTRTNKLNSYDDFAAAADYLNQQGYADPDHIGIIGGSNGGLLVGAAMVRHPEKYAVVVPEVGVLDNMRQHRMGTTAGWVQEWGIPEDGKKMHDILMSYSPYQNIKDGVCYPATFVKTSKRDDRVVPSHSYKFTAILQEKQSCKRPTLLFAAQHHGHSPNTHAERNHDSVIVTAFALEQMGVKDVALIKNRPTMDMIKTPQQKLEDQKQAEKQAQYRQKQQNDNQTP